ncbi:MAG: carboxymuconolactone decarboxylase family protein [Edaphobacter sp.]
MTQSPHPTESLSSQQQAIIPIAAFGAAGDMLRLDDAINQGLDAGLTVSDIKEVLVQLYAYAGFPRSLNALGQMMTVLESRKKRSIEDAPGRSPGRAIPTGEALLAAGTDSQTKLVGAPVRAPIFDFAPAIDTYLKTHLFGDIFERDNLAWSSREIATVAMLAAMSGTDSQLQSHLRISRNVGLSASQLRQLADILSERVDAEAGRRTRQALQP